MTLMLGTGLLGTFLEVAMLFWQLVLVAPLMDAMSHLLLPDILSAPRQPACFLQAFLGNGLVFSVRPFLICHHPQWHRGAQLVQTDWTGMGFIC